MKLFKPLFVLSVFTLSLGQFSALSKQDFTNLYLFDIVLGLFVLLGFYYFFVVKKSFVLPSVSILFLSFTVIAMISLFKVSFNYNEDELFTSFFYLLRWFLYLSFGLVTFNLLHHSILTHDYIINTFVSFGILIGIVGLIQLIVFPDLSLADKSLGWDPHKNRLFSTFLDPNFVGAYLNLILLFFFNKYYSGEKLSTIEYSCVILLLLSLIFTFSRSAWFMFSIIVLMYGLFRSRMLLLTFLIIAFATYFAIPRIQTRVAGITDPADSAHFRLVSWSNTLSIIQDNLLLGVGFNTFRYAQKEYGLVDYSGYESHGASGSDSSLLFVLATTGIFGLMFFLGGFMQPLFKSKNLLLKTLIVSLLLESFFINSLFYPQILIIWIVLLINYSTFDI